MATGICTMRDTYRVEVFDSVTSLFIPPESILVLPRVKRGRFVVSIRTFDLVHLVHTITDLVKLGRLSLNILSYLGRVHLEGRFGEQMVTIDRSLASKRMDHESM